MTHREELRKWLKENRPDVDARIGALPLRKVREVLNEVTGLELSADGLIEEGCARYLEAFKRMEQQHASPSRP